MADHKEIESLPEVIEARRVRDEAVRKAENAFQATLAAAERRLVKNGDKVYFADLNHRLLHDPAGADVATFSAASVGPGSVFVLHAAAGHTFIKYGDVVSIQSPVTTHFMYDRGAELQNYVQVKTAGSPDIGERFTLVNPLAPDSNDPVVVGAPVTLRSRGGHFLTIEAGNRRWTWSAAPLSTRENVVEIFKV